jgi:hypothetical protein
MHLLHTKPWPKQLLRISPFSYNLLLIILDVKHDATQAIQYRPRIKKRQEHACPYIPAAIRPSGDDPAYGTVPKKQNSPPSLL